MDDRPSPLKPPPRPLSRPAAVPARPPARRWLIWGLAALVVLGALGWVIFHEQPKPRQSGRFTGNGPMPVVAAPVATGDMPVTLNALGTVTPLAMVTVRTQINGQLTQVAFREGQEVTKGDFLAEIDPRPYQAALENAQGVLARDQAQLENAKRDLARYTKLAAENSIAVQQRDTQEALVKQLIGTIASDQAAVDTAQLNLAYCHIVAPVSGRVGLRQVDPGNYVQVSDANGIVIITQLKPISAIFTLPEDNLPAITKRLNAGATLAVTAYDRSRTTKLADGTLTTVDNQIDTTTGTVKMRAQFDNSDEILFPNQFVNVQLLVDTIHNATLVSSAAIERGAPGTFVYIVKPDNTVAVQAVKLGPSDGDRVAVTSGLTPGQQVVVDGADKLRDGAKIALPAEKPQGAPAAGEASNTAPANGQATGEPATSGQASKTDAANGDAADPAKTGQQRHRGSQQQ